MRVSQGIEGIMRVVPGYWGIMSWSQGTMRVGCLSWRSKRPSHCCGQDAGVR